jgi:membrane carboxypeptidase/penicillin-binding protein
MRSVLEKADPLDRSPPSKVHAYIQAQHGGALPSAVVARQLHSRWLPRRGMLDWHVRSFLWERLVSLHLSQEEVLGLYASLAYNGQGQGMNSLSQRLFTKPLDALSDQEAAMLVAYTWAPDLYARHPERLRARTDLLLSRVRSTQLSPP